MSKILRFLTCLFCIVFIGDAVFAAGYECPTNRKYTSCNEGYYLAYSYSGTSGSNLRYYLTPRAGNACRPCSDYDTYNNSAEGSYYCEGGTEPPLLNIFTITYNLNGGSGTTPDNEFCTRGQTCTLNDGATTSFYRAGYVFKGWSKSSSATTGSIAITFTANDTVYAVWEPCGIGKYKPGSGTQAAAACSSCPELPRGFAYGSGTGLIDITQCSALATNMAAVDADCSYVAWDMVLRVTSGASSNWDALRTDPVPTGMLALAGTYVNPDMVADTAWKSIDGFNADDLCLPCPDGTYNDGQNGSGKVATECTACPGSTRQELDALPVSTGGTGATSYRQCYKYIRLAEVDSNCVSGEVRYRCTANTENSVNYQTHPIPAQEPELAPVAAPGHVVSLPSDMIKPSCSECGAGTYSAGGTVYSCSPCPKLTPGFKYLPTTGNTSLTACIQGIENAADVNKYCAASSEATEEFDIQCQATSDGTWGDCAIGNAWTAKPGSYVGIWKQEMPAEDVIENMCIQCGVGTYSEGGLINSCSSCPSGYDDNPETGLTSADMCQISCPGGYYLAAANDATCSEVSPGYWAAEKIVNYGDTSTRTECASGLTTIGYGAGADEAADCGRVLHFGNDTLYLRSVKKTDHALHVGINGDVFYGNMGTDLSKSGLRIKLGDTTYSVYDDSMQ